MRQWARLRRAGTVAVMLVQQQSLDNLSAEQLREMTARGDFRADLYDRLNVLSLNTIPLREQKEKIRELILAGLERERIAAGRKNNFQIEPLAFALLENYAWTGNFRELHNFVLKLTTELLDAEIIAVADKDPYYKDIHKLIHRY